MKQNSARRERIHKEQRERTLADRWDPPVTKFVHKKHRLCCKRTARAHSLAQRVANRAPDVENACSSESTAKPVVVMDLGILRTDGAEALETASGVETPGQWFLVDVERHGNDAQCPC